MHKIYAAVLRYKKQLRLISVVFLDDAGPFSAACRHRRRRRHSLATAKLMLLRKLIPRRLLLLLLLWGRHDLTCASQHYAHFLRNTSLLTFNVRRKRNNTLRLSTLDGAASLL